jgi:hypothetical protein
MDFRSFPFLVGGNLFGIRFPSFDNGAAVDASAITFFNGMTGVTGAISAANSFVGTTGGDNLGSAGIAVLLGDVFGVYSPLWDNGAAADAGAITWGSLAGGLTGTVNAANSVFGTQANDSVGASGAFGYTLLSGGARFYNISTWNDDRGAMLWVNPAAPPRGAVSAANSLVGSTPGDMNGRFFQLLFDTTYGLVFPNWDNGGAVDAGAVMWVNGATGVTGLIGAAAQSGLEQRGRLRNLYRGGLAAAGRRNHGGEQPGRQQPGRWRGLDRVQAVLGSGLRRAADPELG